MFVLIEHDDAYSMRNFDRSVRCNARTISDFLCRLSDSVGPVCPQKLPDIANEQEALERMPKGRLEYLKRLLPHLRTQSEDCLYLNIYAPAMGEWTYKPSSDSIARATCNHHARLRNIFCHKNLTYLNYRYICIFT